MLQEKYEKERKKPFDYVILTITLVINLIGIVFYSYNGLIIMIIAAIIGLGIMIWYFMKDYDYKIQYFLGYMVCNFILKRIAEASSKAIHSSIFDLIALILLSFIGAFSYQFFKIMSYKKLLKG